MYHYSCLYQQMLKSAILAAPAMYKTHKNGAKSTLESDIRTETGENHYTINRRKIGPPHIFSTRTIDRNTRKGRRLNRIVVEIRVFLDAAVVIVYHAKLFLLGRARVKKQRTGENVFGYTL
ncbi:hypothetical protein QTP88_003205 [Uroleucon formosanum]